MFAVVEYNKDVAINPFSIYRSPSTLWTDSTEETPYNQDRFLVYFKQRGSIVTSADFITDAKLMTTTFSTMTTATLSLIGSILIVYMIATSKGVAHHRLRRIHQDRPAKQVNDNVDDQDDVKESAHNNSTNRNNYCVTAFKSSATWFAELHSYRRLLFMMSACDILNSFWLALGPLPVMADTGILFAKGNRATCTATGFFFQLGFSVMYYNMSLMLYYALTIRFGMKEENFARRIEPFLHIFSMSIPFIDACIALGYQAFNPWAYSGCYLAPFPPFCGNPGAPPCERGFNASRLYWIFALGPQLVFMACFIIFGVLIYSSVRQQMQVAKTSSNNNNAKKLREWKQAVTTQSILYALIFVNTHIWFVISSLMGIYVKNFDRVRPFLYCIIVLSATFYPAQGFFNFFIFIRPKYLRERQQHPELWWYRILWSIIFTPASDSANDPHDEPPVMMSTKQRLMGEALRKKATSITKYSDVSGIFQSTTFQSKLMIGMPKVEDEIDATSTTSDSQHVQVVEEGVVA